MKKTLLAVLLAVMLAIPALAVDPQQNETTFTTTTTEGYCGFLRIEREDQCVDGLYRACERKWFSVVVRGHWFCIFEEECRILGDCEVVQASDEGRD